MSRKRGRSALQQEVLLAAGESRANHFSRMAEARRAEWKEQLVDTGWALVRLTGIGGDGEARRVQSATLAARIAGLVAPKIKHLGELLFHEIEVEKWPQWNRSTSAFSPQFTTDAGEGSRMQVPAERADRDYLLSRWLSRLRRHVDAAKREIRAALGHMTIGDTHYVLSLAGQEVQPPHVDSHRTRALRALCRSRPDHAPLSVFVSAQYGTRLRIWPRTHRLLEKEPPRRTSGDKDDGDDEQYTHRDITIPPGHMLIIRYDLLHAGLAYARPNVRVHFYVSSPLADESLLHDSNLEPLEVMPLYIRRQVVVVG